MLRKSPKKSVQRILGNQRFINDPTIVVLFEKMMLLHIVVEYLDWVNIPGNLSNGKNGLPDKRQSHVEALESVRDDIKNGTRCVLSLSECSAPAVARQ